MQGSSNKISITTKKKL